ncbi:Eco57I restriction-modification methylase domain-containing protein [Glutamicibacter arilaitensis]|uniref:Eco57I restriction-modification methylase domain-containing protein n=1 Tax=Glutamicibacter arilaitensis TaxID=256701 RepID=UPI0038516DB3
MARTTTLGTNPINAADQHRAWLELVDTDGPFIAIPPLKRVWPQGMPELAADRREALNDARKPFETAWERFDLDPAADGALDAYRVARDKWVHTVFRDVAGWAETLNWGTSTDIQATSPNRGVTVKAQAALVGPDGIGAIVHIVDPTDSLRQTPGDLWAATPIDRLEAMLRANRIEIGFVTDGRWWGLVSARDGAMTASGIVDALTWTEEARTRDAFFTLLDRQYLIGGIKEERLPALFEESIAAAEEITEALGAQVRRAVELLIQSFSESDAEARSRGLDSPLPQDTHDAYEAAVTVMMRSVFLLFAEERGLLPAGELFSQGYGIAQEMERLQNRKSEEGEESLDSTSFTWHRLLATSQTLYQGASFENLRMPAYGGSLFDADRFPFLTMTTEQGTLALTVSDRVMLHVLRSVQVADIKGQARQISFRDIDVEQIGYIYEGLIGYTATIATEFIVGLKGKLGEEPEIPLAKLEALAAENPEPKKLAAEIRKFVTEDQPSATPQTVAAIAKALATRVEPHIISALTQAVRDNHELRDRVKPWLGLIRLDLRSRPFVVLAQGLLVTETPSRKNAGAHYTPKPLAEEVVRHALQPLCYSPGPHQTANETEWIIKNSAELLSLKIVDIACGSGAFLVAAARYLAERVVEAWTSEGSEFGGRKDLYNIAMRKVVANCLYGADINDMAVEMCKLSLWLVSLDRDMPFSFVDDKIFHGNSLLGVTDLRQLRQLNIDPKYSVAPMLSVFEVDVDSIIQRATELRRQLLGEIMDSDPARSSAAKRRQLSNFQQVTADLRRIADGIIAAGLELGGKPGKPRDAAYANLHEAVRRAYPSTNHGDSSFLGKIIESGLTPTVETDYARWQPLHWIVEAPDVINNGGFDAIIGNPPFLGGQKLTGAMGTNIRDWFVNIIADGRRGSADLVAYFFLRATALLQANGTLGLIATNTVAQGDTREVGLQAMVDNGFTITRAIQSRPWPAASANLEYAAVWGTRGEVPDEVPRTADNNVVRRISTLLEPVGRVEGNPLKLTENTGIGFIGCYVLGMGFVIDKETAQEWIASDARNAEVLFPYLNGEDLNSEPDSSATRWVIDFNNKTESAASMYKLPFERLEARVKQERLSKPKAVREMPWWMFLRTRPAMRMAIAGLSEVLVIALVSKTVMPMRVSTSQVFAHRLAVFATSSFATQAVLSSSLHWAWSVKYSSTLESRVNYAPSDAFETFPLPEPTNRLSTIGHVLDQERREIMLRRKLGLTKLYNLVNDSTVTEDSDIGRMREIHAEIDAAVVNAFGWLDLEVTHDFHSYRKMERWMPSTEIRTELLDRLLSENHRRHSLALNTDQRQSRADGKKVVVARLFD